MGKRYRYGFFKCKHLLWLAAVLLLAGCAGTPHLLDPGGKNQFDATVDQLIGELIKNQRHTVADISPVAVVPGTLTSGEAYTRLEEILVERLERRLTDSHELVNLSRRNCFAFREGRPLDFRFSKGYDPSEMASLTIYQVSVSSDDILDELRATVTAFDAKTRRIPGITASARFDNSPGKPGHELYDSAPRSLPYPKGLEENPYQSIDRMCFSLAGELADAYKTGIKAGDSEAADEEIQVLLYVKPKQGVDPSLSQTIADTLQQAVIANRGFTCVVSESDFGSVFDQVDFYKSHEPVFNMADPRFQPGTVLLMSDIYPHQAGRQTGVALRALWRVSPLTDKNGAFVPDPAAGTYVSGFTAKSYLLRPTYPAAGKAGNKMTGTVSAEDEKDANQQAAPLAQYQVYFYGFSDTLEMEILPAIKQMPGIHAVRSADAGCGDQPDCRGFIISCFCRKKNLAQYLKGNLQIGGKVVPFRLESRPGNTLGLYYNGGFE